MMREGAVGALFSSKASIPIQRAGYSRLQGTFEGFCDIETAAIQTDV